MRVRQSGPSCLSARRVVNVPARNSLTKTHRIMIGTHFGTVNQNQPNSVLLEFPPCLEAQPSSWQNYGQGF